MKKVLSVIFLLILICIGAFVVSGQFKETFSFKTESVHEQETVNGAGVKSLEVDVTSVDLKVVPANKKDINIELSGEVSERYKDKYKLILTEENGSLKVELEEPTFQVGVMVVNLELVIELPEKEYENIELRTVSGDFQINGIRAVNLTTEVNSGDILLDEVILTSSYTSKVTSGDIHLEQVQGRTFGLTSVSGDMTFKALESETLTAETVSGDITIWDVPGDIILETSSGDITIENMEVQGNMDIEVLSGDVEVTFLDKPSSLDLDFKANSGAGKVYLKEMQFEKNEEDVIAGKIGSGEYTLKVRVASGDFKLN